eukprot:scaffold106223_cov26-Tisochrysis_lutea.AAC.2
MPGLPDGLHGNTRVEAQQAVPSGKVARTRQNADRTHLATLAIVTRLEAVERLLQTATGACRQGEGRRLKITA